MSRSVHTRPRSILAASRVRAPYHRRRVAAIRRPQRELRALKERGVHAVETEPGDSLERAEWLPRIVARRLSPGWHHPASRQDVTRVLRFFGPEVSYGVQSIELRACPADGWGRVRFGMLVVPGQVRLFAQPLPPWTVPGTIPPHELERFSRAGAKIYLTANRMQTIVDWPGDTLRQFMLFDVLMHELGHHLVQQYSGKRRSRALRTCDHEAFAERFAMRCRQRCTER